MLLLKIKVVIMHRYSYLGYYKTDIGWRDYIFKREVNSISQFQLYNILFLVGNREIFGSGS